MKYVAALIIAFITLCRSQTGCPNPDVTHDCKKCTSHDDPHFTTWDGVRYDQHTDGCFKYVTSCPSAAYDLPFEVCGCHYDCGGGAGQPGGPDGKLCPNTIRCVGDLTVTFFESDGSPQMEVKVDKDNPTDNVIDALTSNALTSGTTYTFDSLSSHYFVYTRTGAVHSFDIFSGVGAAVSFYGHIRYTPGNLEIYLDDTYFNDVTCGLCGFLTGIDTDDFTGGDGIQYLTPGIINVGPIGETTVELINDFANTYKCDPSDPDPAEVNCTVGPDALDCYNEALGCCQELWDDIFAGTQWTNDVVDQADFIGNWLINCALDACALTFNQVDCTNRGDEFLFAKTIAYATATAVYDVVPPQTPAPTRFEGNCTAKVCAHGDNRMKLDVSYDSGSNWDLSVASEGDWTQTMTAVINPIDADTVFRFTVTDVSVVGGFLATIQLCGDNGYVFEFYTDSGSTYFDVISDSAGDPLLDVFTEFGQGPWSWHVNEDKVSCMNEDAYWMWNDKTLNTMVFEFYFGHYPEVLQRLECIPRDTPAPTTDCCTMSLTDYMDTCYCSEETGPPSLPPIQIGATLKADTLAFNPIDYYDRSVNSGASVGIHAMDGEMDDVVYKQTMQSMKQIKHMLYGTWFIIISCLVINIAYSKSFSHCNKSETKSVYHSDEEDI